MKLFNIRLFLFVGFSATFVANAQTASLLTLKDAVEIALKNNYNIKLSANNTTIAKNNVTIGNAGMLPSVTGDLSTTNSIQDTRQTKVDASGNTTVTQINGANNSTVNYGVSLNWTIFNGFAMFANYDQLKQLNQLSEVAARDTIQKTIADVITTYYDLVNQDQQVRALKGAIAISRTQLRYANDKFQVGRASRLDVLNAEVNVNTDTSSLLTQIQQYKSIQIRMNQLMVRDLQTDFTVIDTIVIDQKLKLGDILSQAQTANPEILIAQLNRSLAETNLRQVKATRYPVVGVSTGYGFTDSKTPAGFARQQNSKGLNYGLTASVNIFDGLNQWRRERNAKLQIDNAAISVSKTKQAIEAQINNYYVSYLYGLDLVKLNQSNVVIAKRNLDISLEKYKLGNITPLEIREAQKNYLDAQSRYFQAQYQAKSSEITLKEITNSINIQ
ncbi:TolC family protein [Mucilaginibacter paludis]|uniref:Outer membrane efflux protein n=1 Tax=Mucilaginibacter paludis DSM 18603 TaxID=714943 RepID=H1Y8S9_9SPHI|nr:TolC family protein [Mucilaginibacter paludis]EHQ26951.1 outer membrane efflux protein [Mucilaginibacter paludis DSM 18603]